LSVGFGIFDIPACPLSNRYREIKDVEHPGGLKSKPIILASQWLFDSHTGHDELSYVQAMVVLEILLGDKAMSDEIGLGRLLGNRCAYLIGVNHEQRSELLRRFSDIYAVRSEIVHRGKHRLNVKERGLLHTSLDVPSRTSK
jgi:hypothetical protein